MGVEYRLLKLHRPESYDLGKGRLPGGSRTSMIRSIMGAMRNHDGSSRGGDSHETRSIWSIAQDGDQCAPVRLDLRWKDETRLAELVLSALDAARDADSAGAIALNLLRWAGSDEVILVADNLDGAAIAVREGTTVSNWMETGSAYTPGTRAGPEGGEAP